MSAQSALRITEICRYICFYVKGNRDTRYRNTLGSLARCSQAFSDVALGALWEHIDSLEPLMKLIPSSALERGEGQNDEDDNLLQAAELARISFHSRRVRILTYDHRGDFSYRTVIGQLADYPETTPLLPRLNSLTYQYDFYSTVPHMIANLDTFFAICPRFQKLTLQGRSPYWSHRDRDRDQTYFDVLPRRLPHVRDFVIKIDFNVPKLHFTAQFEHLRSLEIGVAKRYSGQAGYLQVDALQAIAGLRNLESLSIGALRISPWPPVPSLAGFPSLRSVRIVQGDHEGVYALLSHVTSPFLSEIDLTLKHQEYDWKRDITPCFTLLSTRFGSSLESLTWRAEKSGDFHSDAQEFRELKTHFLRPLFSLSRLKHLDLQMWTNMFSTEWLIFSPQEAEEMSRAWMNLESFSLSPNFSYFSLASLVPFVLGCRHLIYLEIPVLFVDDHEIEMASDIPFVNTPPRFLELKVGIISGGSSSPYADHFRAYLYQVFPRLRML
ncbi:hypothetical protein JAAARDRAFT_210544 [Jaapia argillacea MUCL 33604]|uniref:F-box domain-containing protein n=1 Tax=Jaapia argillacea MUCL 33604 TaxID=933084 RepID=A0A067PQM5_9AGAM|nr:hypothetical protein JAAARDRAFT_210544 [Jaapia argillacea MUCL 33604]